MENYEYYVCKECQTIAWKDKAGNCKHCGKKYEAEKPYRFFTRKLMLREDPKKVAAQDALDDVQIKRKSPSAAELKRGVKSLFGYWGMGLLLAVIGFFCLSYPNRGFRHNTMKLMGLLFLVAVPVLILAGVFSFLKIVFSQNRAKSAEKAFRSFWETSVFQTKVFSAAYEEAEVAVGRIVRSLPASIQEHLNPARLQLYIETLRDRITRENDRLEKESKQRFGDCLQGLASRADRLLIENLREESMDDHTSRVHADILVIRECSRSVNNGSKTDTYSSKVAATELRVSTSLLRTGKYWYVADLMPEICEDDRVDTQTEVLKNES